MTGIEESNGNPRQMEFNVSGMVCQGCEQAMAMLLRQHDAVDTVAADAKSGKVSVTLNRDVEASELIDRISSAGYDVK